jgi:RNA polymerase-binding transcription factor DksA
VPGAELCADCQYLDEKKSRHMTGGNGRGRHGR